MNRLEIKLQRKLKNKNLYRKLSNIEIKELKSNGNSSDNWANIIVTEKFNSIQIQNSTFTGEVKIGSFINKYLKYDNLQLPTGIYNSMIKSSAIGDNCAIHNAKYISDYTIESNVLIFNIDEFSVSHNPHFGNGYLKENGSRNWISVINESGLRYIVLAEGSGDSSPGMGTKVTVHYAGSLLNGKEFDSSIKRGEPAEFAIGQVIEGWNEALQTMKKGEKRTLIIPPELGYGERGHPGVIPPNSFLIFDVELIDF